MPDKSKNPSVYRWTLPNRLRLYQHSGLSVAAYFAHWHWAGIQWQLGKQGSENELSSTLLEWERNRASNPAKGLNLIGIVRNTFSLYYRSSTSVVREAAIDAIYDGRTEPPPKPLSDFPDPPHQIHSGMIELIASIVVLIILYRIQTPQSAPAPRPAYRAV